MRIRRRRYPEEPDSLAVQLRHARARLEIIEAIAAALERRDEVLGLVAAAPDTDHARDEIMRLLNVGSHPATAVLDVQVRRFTERERQKIIDEQVELRAFIQELEG